MGCTTGHLACQAQPPAAPAPEGCTQEGGGKVPEVLSSLERLSQATGGMEKSWYRCIFPFGIISLVIGVAGTGVTYTYNDLPQTKVVSVVLLIAGLLLVLMATACWTAHKKKRRKKKEAGPFSMSTDELRDAEFRIPWRPWDKHAGRVGRAGVMHTDPQQVSGIKTTQQRTCSVSRSHAHIARTLNAGQCQQRATAGITAAVNTAGSPRHSFPLGPSACAPPLTPYLPGVKQSAREGNRTLRKRSATLSPHVILLSVTPEQCASKRNAMRDSVERKSMKLPRWLQILAINQDPQGLIPDVLHCRCSKCFSLPARKRVRKQVPSLTLLSLPEEVLLCVLHCLSAEDLLAVRTVHSRFRDIIDNNSSVWARGSFKDSWPAPDTVWLFEKAAEKGNFEAAVKLGIAYLYNEGPSLNDEGRAQLCGMMAARYFALAESLRSPLADPFIWLFIRPPWSPSGSCCKAVVYNYLETESDNNMVLRGTLLHCLARVLQLFDDEVKQATALELLEESACCGSVQSSYLLWEQNRSAAVSASSESQGLCRLHRRAPLIDGLLPLQLVDPGRYLQCVRTLRDYATKGCWEAQLSLAKSVASGSPLGLEARTCTHLVAQLFHSCPLPQRRLDDPHALDINDTMRYILVDWLVEVTTMKDFSSLALHVAVGCVDRYLSRRSVPKARLQLLGIACMVICTRYISKEILTIREAVWLTDNTYQYEDLVRMMGEVISVLEGKIRTPTVLDYGEVLQSLMPMERRSSHLYNYVCELSLLYSALAVPGPARLACAALLLARALHNYAPVWPSQLVENTGFSKELLVPVALLLYIKCFSQDTPKDYRHVSLTGVKQRFEGDTHQQISKEKVMGFKDVCQVLEVPEMEPQVGAPSYSGPSADIPTFLSSPSGKRSGIVTCFITLCVYVSNSSVYPCIEKWQEDSMQTHRGSFVATPTAELSTQEETLLGDILDWSLDASCSGYEGDQESEGEREAETSVMSVQLLLSTEHGDGQSHCRALSDDDDGGMCAAEDASSSRGRPYSQQPLSSSRRPLRVELHSSGYSSVQSSSPAVCSLMPCSLSSVSQASVSASPGFRLLVPMQRPDGASHRQVKRKNTAAHSGGEMEVETEMEEGEPPRALPLSL
ncbi:hypothetical protein P4O66_007435 [Electrophorus voltai]|uniref:Cyclin-F n=1 Tax=Electrophorus voltai TaxID=2609070 RepID=A0AAD9DXK0_9TELE|nr:hypothetical protein P4O66_007435 [Electrophorus voltai]